MGRPPSLQIGVQIEHRASVVGEGRSDTGYDFERIARLGEVGAFGSWFFSLGQAGPE
jgi:hypothetical protein